MSGDIKIIKAFPPNINEIRRYLYPPKWAVFPYKGAIYSPEREELDADIIYHEAVHFDQQDKFGDCDLWWAKYLTDREFRLECELEAYGKQYLWIKERVPSQVAKLALEEIAEAFSKWYNLPINKYQAETLIRKYGN